MKKILFLSVLISFLSFCSVFADESQLLPPSSVPATQENSKINSFSENNSEDSTLKGYLEYDASQNEPEEQTLDENENEEITDYIKQERALENTENTVGLEDNEIGKHSVNIKAPPKFKSKSLITKKEKENPQIQTSSVILNTSSRFADPEYQIGSVSTSYVAKSGNFSVGTSYYSGLDSASLSSSTGVFTRYDGKHFAISSSFNKSGQYNDNNYSDNFSVAPELKITKRLSFVDVLQTDANQLNKSNKMVLRYNPKIKSHTDDVQLEFGFGQSFYENQYVKSSVSFSTRFKI